MEINVVSSDHLDISPLIQTAQTKGENYKQYTLLDQAMAIVNDPCNELSKPVVKIAQDQVESLDPNQLLSDVVYEIDLPDLPIIELPVNSNLFQVAPSISSNNHSVTQAIPKRLKAPKSGRKSKNLTPTVRYMSPNDLGGNEAAYELHDSFVQFAESVKRNALNLHPSFYQKRDPTTMKFLRILRLTIIDQASHNQLNYKMGKKGLQEI